MKPVTFELHVQQADDPEAERWYYERIGYLRRLLPSPLRGAYRSLESAPDYMDAVFELSRFRIRKEIPE